ncbi:hypothetical protein SteCoe_11063 [Stentor coeruleus]|uniref:tRNA (guanine(26)-N(2))-dimethyltransferase n=1 Tax=Stentor coeruleus TaxID=5963 RepID=A0A1R2CDZ6_9CILI|nr:hypothetical protein SteCoe_11063 [Stentor coeruleus]
MVSHIEGAAQILLKGGVFMNPAQVFNRDMSMLVASAYAQSLENRPLHILEPLAATGLRSIRYFKELNHPVERIVANDIDPSAVEQIKENFASNSVTGEVWQKDACDAMYTSRGLWDIVDIDPYGSAAGFLDAAVRAVKSGGLLCVTSTDMITLCGNNPDTCFYKYQSIPSKSKYCHEFALRILLYQLNATANKYQFAIQPLISLSVDFYVRVFVKVISSAQTAKKSIGSSSLVFQCSECPAYFIQGFGREHKGKDRWVGNVLTVDSNCPYCAKSKDHEVEDAKDEEGRGGQILMQGPIYTGPLHDKEFVEKVLVLANLREFKTKDKVRGVLYSIREELETPLGINIGNLCKFFKVPAMSQKNLRSAMKSIGKDLSQSHTNPLIYKTTASFDDIYDIFRYWKKLKAPQRYLTNILKDSPAYRVLTKEPKGPAPDFDQDLTEHEKSILGQIRYPINEPNWGPKPRPKKEEE